MVKEVRTIDILQVLKDRRSIHQFKDVTVSNELLTEIFTYATWAPTHYMKEPWQVKMYQNEGKHTLIDATVRSYQRLGMMKSDESEKTLKLKIIQPYVYVANKSIREDIKFITTY